MAYRVEKEFFFFPMMFVCAAGGFTCFPKAACTLESAGVF